MVAKETTEAPEKVQADEREYFLPEFNKTVKATSIEKAVEIAQKGNE